MSEPVYAIITADKDTIIFEYTYAHESARFERLMISIDRWGEDKLGKRGDYVENIKNVCISREAYALLESLPCSDQDVCEIDIVPNGWEGWKGLSALGIGTKRQDVVIIDSKTAKRCRDFVLPPIEDFQIVKNEVSEKAQTELNMWYKKENSVSEKTIYAEVTAYNDILVIEYKTEDSNDMVTSPYDKPGNLGYVIGDTGHVGISEEAYALLSLIKRSGDAIGDIDIFKLDKGGYAFSTLGGMCSLINPKMAAGSRDFVVPPLSCFQVIANDVPEGAKEAIDSPRDDEDE